MPVNIQLPEDDIPELILFYENKKTEVQEQINKLASSLNGIEDILAKLRYADASPAELVMGMMPMVYGDGYNTEWTWKAKVEFIIKNAGEPLSTKSIVDKIMEKEPVLERTKVTGSISSILTSSQSKFLKIKQEGIDPKYKISQ